MKLFRYFFLLFILSFSSLFAQEGFYYQAVIKNPDGSPLKETQVAVKISIVSNTTTLYTEQRSIDTSKEGFIHFIIGENDPASFSGINWNQELFLEDQIDINDGQGFSTPSRMPLLKSPRAYVADRAVNIYSKDGVLILNSGDTGTKATFTGNLLDSAGGTIIDNTAGSVALNAATLSGNLTGNVTGNVTGDLTGDVTGTVSSLANQNTDALTEGSTNLYFTNARAQGAITAGTGVSVTNGEVAIGQAVGTTDDVAFNSVTAALTGDVTGTVSSLANQNTDALTEGSTNLYFTNARAQGAITAGTGVSVTNGEVAIGQAVGTTDDVAFNSVTAALTGDVTGTVSSLANQNTDALTEGSTNLYFTNARAQGAITAGTGVSVTNGEVAIGQAVGTTDDVAFNSVTAALTGDVTGTVSSLANQNTDALTEGSTNLYFTNARAQGAITAGTGVSVTNGEVAIGQAVGTTDDVAFNSVTAALTGDVTGTVSSLANQNTDALTEGSTNLYFTNARAQGAITAGTGVSVTNGEVAIGQAVGTTDDVAFNSVTAALTGDVTGTVSSLANQNTDALTEGSTNLYFTNARAQGAITAGTGVSVTNGEVAIGQAVGTTDDVAFNSVTAALTGDVTGTVSSLANQNTDALTEGSTNLYFTNARAQGAITAGTGVSVTNGEVAIGQAVGTTDDVAFNSVTAALTGDVTGTVSSLANQNTDALTEGSTNLYFTNARAQGAITAGTGVSVTNGEVAIGQAVGTTDDVAFNSVTAALTGDVTGTVSSLANQNTDALTEGSTNLYFTNARAQGAITAGTGVSVTNGEVAIGQAVGTTDDVAFNSVTAALTGDVTGTVSSLANQNTDALTEGSTNLYFTNARAQGAITAGTGVSVTNGEVAIGQAVGTTDDVAFNSVTAALTGDVTGTVSSLANQNTDALTEGSTNLYFTNARAQGAITAGTGVSVTNGEVAIGQAVGTTDDVAFNSVTAALTGDVTGTVSSLANQNTDALTEGSTNLYFTNARAQGAITAGTGVSVTNGEVAIGQAVGTTDDVAFNSVTAALTGDVTGTVSSLANQNTDALTEGSTNLYFTNARAQGAITAGTGVSVTNGEVAIGQAVGTTDDVAFNSVTAALTGDVTGTVSSLANQNTDALTEGSTNLYFTNARAQGAITAGTGVSVTNGEVAIGQAVGTTDDVAFNSVTAALTGDVTGTVSSLANQNTDALTEGSTNLYFTNARAQGAITAGTGVSVTNGEVAIGQAVGTTDDVAFNSVTAALTGDVTGTVSSLANQNTDALTEGSTNLYFTNARAQGAITAGTGVSVTNGEVAIGQAVGTTDDVAFNSVTAALTGNVTGNLTGDVTGQVSEIDNHLNWSDNDSNAAIGGSQYSNTATISKGSRTYITGIGQTSRTFNAGIDLTTNSIITITPLNPVYATTSGIQIPAQIYISKNDVADTFTVNVFMNGNTAPDANFDFTFLIVR